MRMGKISDFNYSTVDNYLWVKGPVIMAKDLLIKHITDQNTEYKCFASQYLPKKVGSKY